MTDAPTVPPRERRNPMTSTNLMVAADRDFLRALAIIAAVVFVAALVVGRALGS
jgi:hypothetical protein